MEKVKIFIELTRLNKPIGFMLLFWPCLWGLTLAFNFNENINLFLFYGFLFLSGSILMRSAGCIVNDITDKNFDILVERTKNRPIASEKISIKLASFYALILCGIAFLVLINFNNLTIWMALLSMPLAISSFIGLPEITKNLAPDLALTLKFSPLVSNIKVLSIT